jgi:hypothetical protein
MSGCSVINYKGKDIVYNDLRGLSGPELLSGFKLSVQKTKEYKGKELCLLANFTDTVISDDAMKYLKSEEVINGNKLYKKIAVVGATGLKKAILNIYNTITGDKTKAFDTEEEAKEYLIK